LTVLALVAWRLVAAALTPLTFDEAYYRMWSKHLASGYYDHPPMVALVIRLGTMISGDTEQPGSRIFRHRALFTINFHYKSRWIARTISSTSLLFPERHTML
jgi:hypothetical protein